MDGDRYVAEKMCPQELVCVCVHVFMHSSVNFSENSRA